MPEIRKILDGNAAAVEAMRLANIKIIAAYPITPQSPIAEKLSEMVANGCLAARYIRVESEHSALSCAIGAQLTGVRTATATSSVGLALMHEVLGVASGCRVPIVMPVVNRALVSPWSLWCDHQDSMTARDTGWLQFYVENAQEVLDTMLIAYKVAEHENVLTPVMVCLDGFYVSHSNQVVLVPDQDTVDRFLPAYQAKNMVLDASNPMFINDLTPPSEFAEFRYQQKIGFEKAAKIIPEIQSEFFHYFGRDYQMVESFQCEDAEAVLVTMGSVSGTAKYVVKKLRAQNKKVGMVKLSVFRPFPVSAIRQALANIPRIGVLDRSAGLGAQGGPLWLEVQCALRNQASLIQGYIAGLGGRDIHEPTIEKIFQDMMLCSTENTEGVPTWIDTNPEAMRLRTIEEVS